MKLCVLVKEVPDPGRPKRIDASTGRLDRTGERGMNPFDLHALEAAARLREASPESVVEIVALTMGPPSAASILRRAVSLGADRGLHLCDTGLVGSCAMATGYALAGVLARERPDLVLLGQQSDDGECYAMATIVAEHLEMPALTQVIRLELSARTVRCERQAEYGYDSVDLDLPAVISVGDAINEPRYPSLRSIAAAGGAPVQTLSLAEAGIDPDRVGVTGSRTRVLAVGAAPRRPPGELFDAVDPEAGAERILAWLEERRLLP